MKWFRFYSEALHDPKIQRLSGNDFKAWVNLLCLANDSEPRGTLPNDSDVAFALRMKPLQAGRLVAHFHEMGFLDADQVRRCMTIHNWWKWQPDSDDAAGRMRNKRRTSSEQPPNKFALEEEGEEEQNRSEEEGEGDKSADAPNVHLLYQQSIGPMSPVLAQLLDEAEESFGYICIAHCLEEAAAVNKRSLKYAIKIAERHQREGCYGDKPGGNGVSASRGTPQPIANPYREREPELILDD